MGQWVMAVLGEDGRCNAVRVERVEKVVEEMIHENLVDPSQFYW